MLEFDSQRTLVGSAASLRAGPSSTPPLNHYPPLPLLAAACAVSDLISRAMVFLRTTTRCIATGVRFQMPGGVEVYMALSNIDHKREKCTLCLCVCVCACM